MFSSVQEFEYTPECCIFDLLHVSLYHGWLAEPAAPAVQRAVAQCGYNQLVDKIITNKSSDDPELSHQGQSRSGPPSTLGGVGSRRPRAGVYLLSLVGSWELCVSQVCTRSLSPMKDPKRNSSPFNPEQILRGPLPAL